MSAPIQPEPVPQPMQPPVMPWTPFKRLPTDTEPENAKARRMRLARLIDSSRFESYSPEWQQVALMEYEAMRTIESQAAQAAAMVAQPQPKPQQGKPNAPGQQPAG